MSAQGRDCEVVTTVVIGAGHAGLAVSHFLTERSIDHVVLERGEVANSWRTERWDSLRLLTPNWQSRLPGLAYDGDDPDGFMTHARGDRRSSTATRGASQAPVRTGTTVTAVRARRRWVRRDDATRELADCRAVVLASGAFNLPTVPAVAGAVPASVDS